MKGRFIVQLPYLEDEIVLQPWEQNPLSLVNWFDMLNFSARQFFYCGGALRDIRQDAVMSAAVCADGNEARFAMPKDIDAASRKKAIAHLEGIEPQFRTIGLAIAAEFVRQLIADLKKDHHESVQWLIDHVDAIEKIAEAELKDKAFFYIPAERMKFWPKAKEPFAFGRAVSVSFPSTTFDVNNAATSLATSHSTASVFHLMRVLEIGLAALGKEFGVSLEHTNWQPAIDQIEKKIRQMPQDAAWRSRTDFKEYQEFYAQAASHFAILKDAWRNHTMHVRGKYTEEEAERIFENVKSFMQKLAEKLAEDELIPYGKP
jgi:hypothetical protein